MKNLNLRVFDNAFNSQKARILYDGLMSSQIKNFNFINEVQPFSYKEDEGDSFAMNVGIWKELPTKVNATWGSTTL